jgi:hypothetical protein
MSALHPLLDCKLSNSWVSSQFWIWVWALLGTQTGFLRDSISKSPISYPCHPHLLWHHQEPRPTDLNSFFFLNIRDYTSKINKQKDGSLSYVHILWHPGWTAVMLPRWAALLQLLAKVASRMWLNACKLTYMLSGPPFPIIKECKS